jgi:hypothetical protein
MTIAIFNKGNGLKLVDMPDLQVFMARRGTEYTRVGKDGW